MNFHRNVRSSFASMTSRRGLRAALAIALVAAAAGGLTGQAQLPLAISQLIGSEQGLDNLLSGPTPSTQAAPAIAASGEQYLVVWAHGGSELTSPGV